MNDNVDAYLDILYLRYGDNDKANREAASAGPADTRGIMRARGPRFRGFKILTAK